MLNINTLFLECADGFYNSNCTGPCGHCINDTTCKKDNGYCVGGCRKNYVYPLCKGNVNLLFVKYSYS